VNHYTITFDTKGGSTIDPLTLPYYSPITVSSHPTKEGYTFNGWSSSVPSHLPAANLTLTAYWLKSTVVNDSEVVSTIDGLVNSIDDSLLANKDAEVVIHVEQIVPSTLTPDLLGLIETHLEKMDKFNIIDIRVLIRAAGYDEVVVHQLDHAVTITLSIPASAQGFSNYRIIRIHDGQSDVLVATFDEENQTLQFETDRFSNFVIVFEDVNYSWLWWLLAILVILFGYVAYRYRHMLLPQKA
jgi:hypothetical protein